MVNAFCYLCKGSSHSKKKQGSLHSKTPAFVPRKSKCMKENWELFLKHPSQSTYYDPSTLKPLIHNEKIPGFPFTYFFSLHSVSAAASFSWKVCCWVPGSYKALNAHGGSELLCILLDRKTTTKWGNASLKKRKHSFLFVIPCLAFWENCWEIDVAVNLWPSVTSLIEKMTWNKKAEIYIYIKWLIIWYLLRRESKPE